MATGRKKAYGPPTTLAHRYVRLVVGFGIGVGVGLAPFLGKVPGLDALITIFPRSFRGTLIPIAALLMGIVAAAIQFYSGETIRREVLRRRFGLSLGLLLMGLFLLFICYSFFITPVPVKGGRATVPVIIAGPRVQGPSCGCPPSYGTIQCIQELSFEDAAIETCWDAGMIKVRRMLLSLSYLAVTGGFGALIGLLLLQQEASKKQKRRPRKAAAPASPKPEPDHGTS
jgi:hypothetical protein